MTEIMGGGAGVQVDFDFVIRIVELVLLILAIVFFFLKGYKYDLLVIDHRYSTAESMDALNSSCSAFIIMLLILLGLQLIGNQELDETFVGCLAAVGAILLITSGVVVIIYSHDHSVRWIMIGGIVGIVGGCALLVHSLNNFKVF